MNKIANFLNQRMDGNVYVTTRVLDAFSTDRSIMRIRPKFVAVPVNTDEVRKLVRFSHQLSKRKLQLGITVRGSGNDKTGAPLGSGIVISTKKLNSIRELDVRQRLVRVEAGITLGDLNHALEAVGLYLPISADPSHTIGGLLMNGYTGPISGKYGGILNYVEQAEVILSNGDIIHTSSLTPRQLRKAKLDKTLEGEIYRKVSSQIEENPSIIEVIQNSPSSLAGYHNISKVLSGKRLDLLPLFAGSQGTLGIVTELILRCEYAGSDRTFLTAAFETAEKAAEFAEVANHFQPTAVDIYDLAIVNQTASAGKSLHILKKRPEEGFIVLVTFDDYRRYSRKRRAKRLTKYLSSAVSYEISEASKYNHATELNGIIECYLNSIGNQDRLPMVDGAFIPNYMFTNYLHALKKLEKRHKTKAPAFGSYSTQTYSIRPEVNISTPKGRRAALDFLRDYTKIVTKLGGTICGGSPEGRFKAIYLKDYTSTPEVLDFNKSIKEAFDPAGVLNPGVKIDVNSSASIRNLRVNPGNGIITD